MEGRLQLIVFADDWGRHPSSAQHLVRHLLPQHPTLWVNTIGMRAPKLTLEDVGKIAVKLRQWVLPRDYTRALPENLSVLNPRMYPGYRNRWQRFYNRRSVARAIARELGPREAGVSRVVVTTLPTTADLVGHIDADRWVYYCVDDFSVWPGVDGDVMDALERQLVRHSDRQVAVSETLQNRLAAFGGKATLLTHGIDLEHWATDDIAGRRAFDWWPAGNGPVLLFWGVVDRRLDVEWCLRLSEEIGVLVLVGPHQSPDPRLLGHPKIVLPGPVPFSQLVGLAARADLLVMPYRDAPVTRAMQPLKLKEYLATGRPGLVRDLPATRDWSDAVDVVASADRAIELARHRIREGTSKSQRDARMRLLGESWESKASAFASLIRR